jgi:integrase
LEEARGVRDNILAPFRAADKVEALKTLAGRVTVAQNDLTRIRDEQPALALADAWQAYLDTPSRPDSGARTLEGYKVEWTAFAKWIGEKYPEATELRQVTSGMAEEYARHLAEKKFSPSTYNQHRNLLKLVWHVLGEKARCTGNPWDRIVPRKLQAHLARKQALTPVQFTALLDAVAGDQDLHDLFMVLAWTGQRLVDAVMLRWGEIDFKAQVITLTPRKTARRIGKQIHVPIFPALLPVLNRRQEAQGGVVRPAGHVFPELVKEYGIAYGSTLSKRIADAFLRAGMTTSEERDGRKREVCVYGAHSLRHHFVTAAASAGVPAGMIKSITGHATDGMLEHYQHMGAELAGEIAKKIGVGGVGKKKDAVAVRPPLPDWALEVVQRLKVALAAGDLPAAKVALVDLTGNG